MKNAELTKTERHFFKTVYNAAFANPFSELRERLDQKIAGLFPSAARRESKDMCVSEVDRQLKKLDRQNRGNINQYTGEDQEVLRVVYLFDIFHKFRDRFDQLIQDQIAAQDDPVPVGFVDEAREMMVAKGFSRPPFTIILPCLFSCAGHFTLFPKPWWVPAPACRHLKNISGTMCLPTISGCMTSICGTKWRIFPPCS
jgi:hypothetical protein